jgi:putative ABC transport system permease protein
VRQLLTESVLLSAIGGALGLLVAVWGVDALVQLSPSTLPRLHNVSLDRVVFAFTACLSIATGVLFGLMPAIQGSQAELQQVMRDATRSATTSGHVTRMRGALVVGEFALALVLLVGAALLIQSFWRLQARNARLQPESVLTARLWLPQPNNPQTGPYFTHDARVAFYRRVLDRLSALPGVQSVGGISTLPLSGPQGRLSFAIEGRSTDIGDAPSAQTALVTPGYFRTLGIELVRGRLFDDHDDTRSPIAAVVSEAFAKQFFADDPLANVTPGSRVRPADPQQARTRSRLSGSSATKTDRLTRARRRCCGPCSSSRTSTSRSSFAHRAIRRC